MSGGAAPPAFERKQAFLVVTFRRRWSPAARRELQGARRATKSGPSYRKLTAQVTADVTAQVAMTRPMQVREDVVRYGKRKAHE
jgi:hypothetical protein